jgi:sulfur-carrier protein
LTGVNVKILYFASIREAIGQSSDDVDLPDSVTTPAQLADWLAGQGDCYATAFARRETLRCAADQVMIALDAPLGAATEIAFFPPVTGG